MMKDDFDDSDVHLWTERLSSLWVEYSEFFYPCVNLVLFVFNNRDVKQGATQLVTGHAFIPFHDGVSMKTTGVTQSVMTKCFESIFSTVSCEILGGSFSVAT